MNRVILFLPLLLFLAACLAPTPTAPPTLSPIPTLTQTQTVTPSLTPTPVPPSATPDLLRVYQTQNASNQATVAAKNTATAIALAMQRKSPTPTKTEILPTPNPVLTPTPLPPLTAHTWVPQTVLVFSDSFGGDGCCDYRLFPDLVLFGDGQLFITELIEIEGYTRQQVLRAQLDTSQVCSILNSLDQIGFLAYEASTYFLDENGKPQEIFSWEGVGTRSITVNAWQSNLGSFYGLGTYIYENEYHPLCDPCSGHAPTILPALLNTYHFLENIPNLGFDYQIYLPNQLELRVYPPNKSTQFAPDWPFPSISLANLLQHGLDASGNPIPTTITGADAQAIYEYFMHADDPAHLAFKEGDQLYEVSIHPLYFYPWEATAPLPGIPETLTCTPEDGVLEFPRGE
ncbi:MAG TPA: hypothetical protein PK530_09480 [Anaerolineales bacterium]|nr:hypothetical protein [Anaerolineales bacterium]